MTNTVSLALALEIAGHFDLEAGKARAIAAEVGKSSRSGATKLRGWA
jgi:hypothetical protein